MSVLRQSIAVSILVATSAPAHAYLDGATASIALQAVIGFFAAWGLYSRRAVGWVKGLFGIKPKEPVEAAETLDADETK